MDRAGRGGYLSRFLCFKTCLVCNVDVLRLHYSKNCNCYELCPHSDKAALQLALQNIISPILSFLPILTKYNHHNPKYSRPLPRPAKMILYLSTFTFFTFFALRIAAQNVTDVPQCAVSSLLFPFLSSLFFNLSRSQAPLFPKESVSYFSLELANPKHSTATSSRH